MTSDKSHPNSLSFLSLATEVKEFTSATLSKGATVNSTGNTHCKQTMSIEGPVTLFLSVNATREGAHPVPKQRSGLEGHKSHSAVPQSRLADAKESP